MVYEYSIYPSVGVARAGNSNEALPKIANERSFFLAPDQIGGLPIECDSNGNELRDSSDNPLPVTSFKDSLGRVKRQAQKFRLYRYNSDTQKEEEVTLDTPGVTNITWTVHLANKKAAWYQFSEYKGNLLFGEKNSYAAQNVDRRNKNDQNRQHLIIDPGPRTISGENQSTEISRDNIPNEYLHGNFPPEKVEYGYPINSLGTLKTDSQGRLLVLGGYGRSGGNEPLSSYGGADTWYDDISDGSVTCTIEFEGELSQSIKAWVIVGSPDFAPELVNISTWDDTMFDVGVRNFNLVPKMYNSSQDWNPDFEVNYQRDILPIIQRISRYHWVANVQSMIAFSSNIFDFSDPSETNKANRQKYFSYFQKPEPPNPSTFPNSRQTTIFSDDQVPKMPLNSGSNSVSNVNIEKFMALTKTQYFLLQQWAEGKFTNVPPEPYPNVDDRNRASVGNCVGLPQCPGIEVTWTTQNHTIYANPYEIKQREGYNYQENGLDPNRDECEGGGCEPGDLTKRMAIPWQADFFNCTVQNINFTDPNVNKWDPDGDGKLAPKPPTYYAYWWPPQAPWDVLGDDLTDEAQAKSHIPAGLQVNYLRGVNSYKQMVENGWSYLGFIRNQNTGSEGQKFPYIVETERDNDMFEYQSVPVSNITGNEDDADTEIPLWYLNPLPQQHEKTVSRMRLLRMPVEEEMMKEIAIAPEQRQRVPRSGTRVRF